MSLQQQKDCECLVSSSTPHDLKLNSLHTEALPISGDDVRSIGLAIPAKCGVMMTLLLNLRSMQIAF